MSNRKFNNNQNGDVGGGSEDNAKVKSPFQRSGDLFSVAAKPGLGVRLGGDVAKGTCVQSNTQYVEALEGFNRLPGISRVSWLPTFGVSGDINSYLNKASMRIYRAIQNELKQRNLPYQHVDVTILLAAMDSLVLGYHFAHRGYRGLNTVNSKSKYINVRLCEALGIDYESWSDARPEIVEQLKIWRKDLLDYPLPRVFSAFDTHYALMSNIYMDATSEKAQMYVCTPDQLYSYEKVDQLGGLTWVTLGGRKGTITWDAFKETFDGMLTAIKNSTDFDIISAAIRTTFADADVYDIPEVTDEGLSGVVDGYFITMLCNCTPYDITPAAPRDSGENFLTAGATVRWEDANNAWVPPHLFNTLEDQPSSEDMVNYASWHLLLDEDAIRSGKAVIDVVSMGTEVITGFTIYNGPDDDHPSYKGSTGVSAIGAVPVQLPTYVTGMNLTLDGVQNMAFVSAAEAFKWHPILWMYVGISDKQGAVYPFTQWNFSFEYAGDDLISAHNAWLDAAFTHKHTSAENVSGK